jgi:hypothetical protein
MNRQAKALQERAAEFARRITALADRIPQTSAGRRIAGQLIDSATSASAN